MQIIMNDLKIFEDKQVRTNRSELYPSTKAEPFKRWLVQVGSGLVEEIENPEIATQRTRELYKLKEKASFQETIFSGEKVSNKTGKVMTHRVKCIINSILYY